jgi:hypothetical protein
VIGNLPGKEMNRLASYSSNNACCNLMSGECYQYKNITT